MMKRRLLWLLATLLLAVPTTATPYRTLHERELPRAARTLLAQHFPDERIGYIAVDREFLDREYKVVLSNGASIEFDKNGHWKEINCKERAVPTELVPPAIRHSVNERFSARRIVKIERDRHGYEVLLEGGIDLEYTHRFQLVEVDD